MPKPKCDWCGSTELLFSENGYDSVLICGCGHEIHAPAGVKPRRTEEEIRAELGRVNELLRSMTVFADVHEPCKPEAVEEALLWVLGETDKKPWRESDEG